MYCPLALIILKYGQKYKITQKIKYHSNPTVIIIICEWIWMCLLNVCLVLLGFGLLEQCEVCCCFGEDVNLIFMGLNGFFSGFSRHTSKGCALANRKIPSPCRTRPVPRAAPWWHRSQPQNISQNLLLGPRRRPLSWASRRRLRSWETLGKGSFAKGTMRSYPSWHPVKWKRTRMVALISRDPCTSSGPTGGKGLFYCLYVPASAP